MRLISIHVVNFGRLSDFTYNFDEKINHIAGANGWGKSTMAAFIRVMFYGFEGEGKRGILDNERKRWEPWQGGQYGGSLTFEKNGNIYTVTRFFRSKAAEDTFELRNADTNLVTEDYSEHLGEELFGVNAASYMRTAFIGQNDVITETTDGINAKIGNIADSTNDLECFDKANDRLASLINSLTPKRVTGSINKLKSEVTRLQTEVRNGSGIVDSIHRLDDSISSRQAALGLAEAGRRELVNKQKVISDYKDIQSVKDIYLSICNSYEERKEDALNKRKAFHDTLPNEEDINVKLEEIASAANLQSTAELYALSSEEATELDRLSAEFADSSRDASKNAELIRRFRLRETRALNEANRQADLKIMLNELEAIKREKKILPSMAMLGIVLIVIAMLTGILSIVILPSIALMRVGVGTAAVLMIAGVALTILKLKAHTEDVEARIEEQTTIMDEIQNEIAEDIRARNEVDGDITEYLGAYGIRFEQSSAVDDMLQIQKDIIRLDELETKKKNYDEAVLRYRNVLSGVDEYLTNLGMVPDDNRQAQLNRMVIDLRSLVAADKVAEAEYKKKEEYEANHDIEKIMSASLPEDMPELGDITSELADINESIEQINGELRDLNRQREDLQEKLDDWEEARTLLGTQEKRLHEQEIRFKRITMAKDFLTTARESMTAKYMDPLIKGFARYYGKIAGPEADCYRIDANTNLSMELSGAQRDTKLLSCGYQDLVGFCMRLSLIDAMYDEERPMLILDDPFVNLDSERMKAAEELLDTLSEKYQLLYFTCR